jgi:hypothetical protein
MNGNDTPILELEVPKPVRVVVGAVVVGIFGTAFLLFFIFLAVYNLSNRMAIIPSAIWLLLVGSVLIGLSKEKGSKQFATEILGAFSRKEFVQTICRENGENEFQYGFRMFGLHFSYFTIAVDKIESVKWNTGQASHFAGRDVGDWHIAVWYDHGDLVKSKKQHWMKNPDQDLYLIGLEAPKEKTAALGHALLDLLQKSGASLIQGNNDCTFVRQSPTA